MKNRNEKIEEILRKGAVCKQKIGNIGPTGPAGPTTIEIMDTITVSSKEKASVNNVGDNQNLKLTFKIPKGDIGPIGPQGLAGPTGPAGPTLIKMAYLVTYNDGTLDDGIEISPLEQIPIERIELDPAHLVSLNNNSIKFNSIGYYKITIITYALPKLNDTPNPETDFISVGFKLNGTDNVYIGGSHWIYDDSSMQIVIHGIISVENTNNEYSFVNLGKNNIFINSPKLKNINSNSYFSNSFVTIIAEYLGSSTE